MQSAIRVTQFNVCLTSFLKKIKECSLLTAKQRKKLNAKKNHSSDALANEKYEAYTLNYYETNCLHQLLS